MITFNSICLNQSVTDKYNNHCCCFVLFLVCLIRCIIYPRRTIFTMTQMAQTCQRKLTPKLNKCQNFCFICMLILFDIHVYYLILYFLIQHKTITYKILYNYCCFLRLILGFRYPRSTIFTEPVGRSKYCTSMVAKS